MNEFKGLELLCIDASVVPSGPGYSTLVCALLGATVKLANNTLKTPITLVILAPVRTILRISIWIRN